MPSDIFPHHTAVIRAGEAVISGAIAVVAPEFAEAIPAVIRAGETLNAALDTADTVIDDYEEVYNETTDTWHRLSDIGRNIADEFGNDDEFINHTQIPVEMSNKATRYGFGSSPGQAPKNGKVPTLTTYAHKPSHGGRSGATSVSMKRSGTPSGGKLTSSLTSDQKYFDSELLLPSGEKRLTALNVKLGKQVYPDCIGPFLEALNGHGKVRMQFAGRCVSQQGQRHTSIQLFRHNLAASTTNAAYPAANLPFILGPGNVDPFYPAGNLIGNSFLAGTTSMRDFLNQKTYWAPYNLSDLEDCSWNLNKLKLGQVRWTQTAGVPTQKFQVPVFQTDSHALSSAIFKNNDIVSNTPTAGGTSPYRYNAVLNKGSVHYDFMNKGNGGAKVEIIIYRVKKSNQLNDLTALQVANNTFCNTAINLPIGAGYMDTQLAQAGTDALGGRPPVRTDVYQDASFPLLPKLKKTKQIDLPFVEVVRQTFAMTSGSRREVTFDLPGEVYDPNNQPGNGTDVATNTQPILNNHTYAVYLSVSGIVCTDLVTPDAAALGTNFNVGDMISSANVQFYATYTEHLGACQYKKENKPNLYSAGAIIAPGGQPNTFANDIPITMVDQNSAVRLPSQIISDNDTATATMSPGISLHHDFSAAATSV